MRKSVAFIFILFSCVVCFSQNLKCNLIQKINTEYEKQQYRLAIIHLSQLKNQLTNKELKKMIDQKIGAVYYKTASYDSCIYFSKKCMDIQDELYKSWLKVLRCDSVNSNNLINNSNYSNDIRHSACLNIYNSYLKKKDFDKAKPYLDSLEHSYAPYIDCGNGWQLYHIQSELLKSDFYEQSNQIDSALKLLLKHAVLPYFFDNETMPNATVKLIKKHYQKEQIQEQLRNALKNIKMEKSYGLKMYFLVFLNNKIPLNEQATYNDDATLKDMISFVEKSDFYMQLMSW